MASDLKSYVSNASDKINDDVLLTARFSCYHARDKFYACLEQQGNKWPSERGTVGLVYPRECRIARNAFVKECRSSWVKHFDREYCSKKTERLLDDCEPRSYPTPMILPMPPPPPSPTSESQCTIL